MPPGQHALTLNEYTIRQPPYADGLKHLEGLLLRAGLERSRLLQEHRRRREGPSVHRARTTRGCGRGAWAARRTSGAGWRCGSPTSTSRRRATTATARTGRSPTRTSRPTTTGSIEYLGISGRQGEPAVPAGQHLPAADAAECGGGHAPQLAEEDGPGAHAVSGRRDDRRAEAQQVSQPLFRARRVQPPRPAAATSTPRSTRRPG